MLVFGVGVITSPTLLSPLGLVIVLDGTVKAIGVICIALGVSSLIKEVVRE